METGPAIGFNDEKLKAAARSLHAEPLDVAKDDLTILHLSDLHFGSNFRFRRAGAPHNTQLPSLAEAVHQALASQGLVPDALVLSGDFGSNSTHLELENWASSEFQKLSDTLNIPFDRWIVIPGNHDIDWGAEQYSGTLLGSAVDKYLEKARDYFHYVYKLVQNKKKCGLANKLRNWKPGNESAAKWKDDPIRHYMPSYVAFRLNTGQIVELHGYNSCLVEGKDWPGIGYVGKGQPRLFEHLSAQSATNKPTLKIAILHHHVKEVSKVVGLPGATVNERMNFSLIADSRWLLDHLIQKGYGMLLHGHQHQSFVSQEILSCFGSDHDDHSWYRNYIDQRLLIFGAGSVSFRSKEDAVDNSFFVYKIDQNALVKAWNFSMGAEHHSGFGVHHSCTQSLRDRVTSDSIRRSIERLLESIEHVRPGRDLVELPAECEPAERVLAVGLHELLTALGPLKRKGETFALNLPEKTDGEEKNLGHSNNLPRRFANLLRLALKYQISLFSDEWLPTGLLTEPDAFNVIRWASLNLARILQQPEDDPDKRFPSLPFALAVLREYAEDLRIPQDLYEQRHAIACAIARRNSNGEPELLLRDHDEWKAMVLPVTEIDEELWSNYDERKWSDQVRLKILHPWFRENVKFEITPYHLEDVVAKMQISPSKGVWTKYHFKLCFLSFGKTGRDQLDALTAPNKPSIHGLSFVPISEIKTSLGLLSDDIVTKPDTLNDSLSRATVMNRALMTRLVAALENPEPGCFYDGK